MKPTSFKKKSLSPLISTILLVVVAVILVFMVLTWGKGFTNSKLSPSTTSFLKSEISSFLFVRSVHQLETENILFIKNAHEKEAISFIGYKLHTDTGYVFENQLLYFDEVKELSPGEIKPLSVVCFPKKSFTIELITDKNTLVNLSIKVPDFTEKGYCMGKEGVVAAYDMKTIVGDQLIDISGNGNDGTIPSDLIQTKEGIEFFKDKFAINLKETIILDREFTVLVKYISKRDNKYSLLNCSDNYIYTAGGIGDKYVRFYSPQVSFNFSNTSDIWKPNTETYYIVKRDFENNLTLYLPNMQSKTEVWNNHIKMDIIGGVGGSSTWDKFEGIIQDIRIYNHALTEQEVKDYHSIMTNPLD